MPGKRYSIKKNRIEKGFIKGFYLDESGKAVFDEYAPEHIMYLPMIDSGEMDSEWGRFRFTCTKEENQIVYLYIAALNERGFYRDNQPVLIDDFLRNEEESQETKQLLFKRIHARKYVDQNDILLYDLKGKYLLIGMEIRGEGKGSIDRLVVDQQGDNFMQTFPEIYRERDGFFHHFMSIFSSIYNDFQINIDELPQILDLDTCPVSLLPVYGRWLGIDVNCDFLEESVMRRLVKEAYHLNRIKGTKECIRQITEIMIDDEAVVLEQNAMKKFWENDPHFEELYGTSIYDVTILIRKAIADTLKSQLLFMLRQFIPIRTRIRIIYLKNEGLLDSHSYLDMNAHVYEEAEGVLDAAQELGDVITLQ